MIPLPDDTHTFDDFVRHLSVASKPFVAVGPAIVLAVLLAPWFVRGALALEFLAAELHAARKDGFR